MLNDDNIPWADPEIKLRYKAALGKFILAYNQIDHQLYEILEMALSRWKRPDLLTSKSFNGSLIKRLEILDILRSTAEGAPLIKLPFDKLRKIHQERNDVAHGHMDQNPFDGSYQLYADGKKVKEYYSISRIEKMAQRGSDLWDSMRYIEANYCFEPITD
ncbi:hypothetical protein [Pedobacter mucosus]|uniref:hypothetical protein n=1 Tax=Pedobacter mucosus TaxID=2895286 RepID=UPI001EE406E8|nr:hypothetical protein [Pedobacter mucosus]UKT64299.1 hypothetical protein LOK61_00645 [Pedobacter mucosus]